MFWFAAASLIPAACLTLACFFGGLWPLASVLAITVFVFMMDRLVNRLMPDTVSGNGMSLSLILAGAHVWLWALVIWAVGAGTHLGVADKLLILIGAGLFFGQISNSNAHELIHKATKWPRRLGVAVYCSILFGHHTSAHTRVHHVHAATLRDPNTARLGEGFWSFYLRAWWSGFVAGKRAEDALRARSSRTHKLHPYVIYLSGAVLAVALAGLIAGKDGVSVLFFLSAYAQIQLYLSDYVQHYGLERVKSSDGKLEPIGPQHSWNAPHWYSSAMMLNAPRHSDHHVNPSRDFPQLKLDENSMPILPHSLPVMAVIALVPPLWRRVMDPRVARWRSGYVPHTPDKGWQFTKEDPRLPA